MSILGRAVNKWLRRHDRALLLLVRYFWGNPDLGIVNCVHPEDMSDFKVRTWWDADHAGSPDTEKSTAGYATWIVGKRTKVLLDSAARLQDYTGLSTPEVETVSGAHALARSTLPIITMMEQVYSRKVEVEIATDNSTAELDITQGFSKSMKHLLKHHRVSSS